MDLLKRTTQPLVPISLVAALCLLLAPAVAGAEPVPYREGFEDPGSHGWSLSGAWHVKTTPQAEQVIPEILGPLVSLPDDGFWPTAWEGSAVLVASDESTGTYIAPWDDAAQSPGNGGLSLAARADTAVTPVITAGVNQKVNLRFRAWWEVESVRPDSSDRMIVQSSVDSGATWQPLAVLADTSLPQSANDVPYTSGGYDAPPVWVERSYGVMSGADGALRFRFIFNTVDLDRNGFRGWFMDDVSVECDSISVPYGLTVTDTVCGGAELAWSDSSLATLMFFSVGRSPVDTARVDTVARFLTATSYTDTTALPGVAYRYAVWTTSMCGSSGESAPDTGGVPAMPVAPGSFSASDSLCSVVRLEWTGLSGGNERGVLVRRDGSMIAALSSGSESYDDSTALAGSTYAYAVGDFGWCDTLFAATDTGGARPAAPDPDSVYIFNADTLCYLINVVWDTVGGDFDEWVVFREGDSIASYPRGSYPFHDDTEADSMTPLLYRVRGRGECGLSPGAVSAVGIRIGRPPTPVGCAATDDRCGEVEITWTPSAAPGLVDSFIVLRDGETLGVYDAQLQIAVDSEGDIDSTYLYEVWAWNDRCGSSVASSADNGTRGAVPPTPDGLTATDSLCTAVEIAWNDTTGFFVEYVLFRDADSIGAVHADSPTVFVDSLVDSAVTAAYKVRTRSECGVSPFSGSDTGMWIGLPPPPTGCEATDSLCGRAVIRWDAPAAPGVIDGYVVRRGGVDVGVVLASASPLTFRDTTGAANVMHFYSVAAWNGCGYSISSDTASGAALSAPGAPRSFTASQDRCNTILLSWEPPDTGGPVGGYRLVLGSPPGGTIDSIAAGTFEYIDSPGETEVVYSLRAFNCEESAAAVDTGRLFTAPPPPPDSCGAAAISCFTVRIGWSAAPGATLGYLVYRDGTTRVDSTGPGGATAIDPNPAAGTDHVYTVFSVNSCGRSAAACSATVRIPGPIDPPPPDACAATEDSCTGVFISWEWTPEDVEWYRVYRVGDGALVDSVPAGVSSVFDGGLSPGESAEYAVQAGNACHRSASSCTTTGGRPSLPSAPNTCSATAGLCDTIRVSWFWPLENIGEEILGFRIFRRRLDQPSAPTDTFFVGPAIGGVTYEDVGVEVGVSYFYRIAAFDRCGETSGNCQASGRATAVPPVPDPVSPADGAANLDVPFDLVWEDTPRATEYRLQVARDDSFRVSLFDTVVADTSFRLAEIDSAGLHHWRVSGVNGCGEGAFSDTRTFSVGSVPGLRIVAGASVFPFGNDSDTLFTDSVFVLENEWFNELAWSLDDTLEWVRFTPAAGTLAPGERESVTVSVGEYRCGVVYGDSLLIESDPEPAGQGPIRISASLDPIPRPAGDVDWDCRVGVDDAARIVEALLGDFLAAPGDSVAADANGDGRIGVADVVTVGWLLAGGLETPPEVEGEFRLDFAAGENRLSAAAPFPVRAVRLLFRVDRGEGASVRAASGTNTLLSYDVESGRGGVFFFSDDPAGEATVPLVIVEGAVGAPAPLLVPGWIEIAGVGGESVRMSIDGTTFGAGTVPERPTLGEVRPNPFNAFTTIDYSLPEAGRVTLRVYDVRGALVRTLVDGRRPAGPSKTEWDGAGDGGRGAPSGVYFVRLEQGGESSVRRMVLLR